MHDIYSFVSGPLVWASFILFIGGCLYRLTSMAVLARKKDPAVYAYMSFRYALRSISHWIIPFRSETMKKHPVFTVISFAFHVSLLVVPLFLIAHIVLIKESWNISWWFLPDTLVDFLTLIIIGCCIYFLVRRIVRPEVKFLTSFSDYLLLALVTAPFVTGFWTYHQFTGYKLMGIIHILCGEIMLAAIPFTRLSHMIFFVFTRGYMGSEFGAVRHARDW
jgi:nitrate reductase gamma subunit